MYVYIYLYINVSLSLSLSLYAEAKTYFMGNPAVVKRDVHVSMYVYTKVHTYT